MATGFCVGWNRASSLPISPLYTTVYFLTESRFEFVHASGPGGQNVNKVATAVKLYFDVVNSPSLSEAIKKRLLSLSGKRITGNGILTIDARRYRTQERNRKDAVDRLASLIRKASHSPKLRKKTSPTKASQEKRLLGKRRRSSVKQLRQTVDISED